MKLSIITVCYNSEKTIERCIRSVLSIDRIEFEYIIVDGASKDRTVKIAESFRQDFDKKGIQYKIISERDTGIYNAMNKGIDLSIGEYILYLNSDDCLCENVDFVSIFDNNNADVIYGDVAVKTGTIIKLQKPRDIERLKSGVEMPFCHQSTLTKKNKLEEYRFDESFKIIADIDLYLRMFDSNESFEYVPICISVFSNDGVSQTNRIESMNEGKKLLKKHNCYTWDRILELNIRILWYKVKRITNSLGKEYLLK